VTRTFRLKNRKHTSEHSHRREAVLFSKKRRKKRKDARRNKQVTSNWETATT
jgi:hypothetical protein